MALPRALVCGYPNTRYNPFDGSGTVPGATGTYRIILTPNPPDNNVISKATPLGDAGRLRVVSNYWIAAADVDLFRFHAAAHAQVTLRIGRPAGSKLASVLRLFDRTGRQLAISRHTGMDAVLSYTFGAAGTYYVGVSGLGNTRYDVVNGTGAQPGSVGGYTLALVSGPAGGSHHADKLDAATVLNGSTRSRRSMRGSIASASDVALFSFDAATGQQLAFTVTAGGGLSPYLRLFDGNGIELSSSAGSGAQAGFAYTFLVGGTYYLGISARGDSAYDAVSGSGATAGTGKGTFTLTVSPLGFKPTPFGARNASPAQLPYSSNVAAVVGMVFYDASGSGLQQPAAVGEGDHMVFVDAGNDGLRGDGQPAAFTNAQGQFLLNVAHAGRASLVVAPMTQYDYPIEKLTTPSQGFYAVRLVTRQATIHVAFGLRRYEG